MPIPPGATINGAQAKYLANAIHDSIMQTAAAVAIPDDLDGCAQLAYALGIVLRVWQDATPGMTFGVLTAAFTKGFTAVGGTRFVVAA